MPTSHLPLRPRSPRTVAALAAAAVSGAVVLTGALPLAASSAAATVQTERGGRSVEARAAAPGQQDRRDGAREGRGPRGPQGQGGERARGGAYGHDNATTAPGRSEEAPGQGGEPSAPAPAQPAPAQPAPAAQGRGAAAGEPADGDPAGNNGTVKVAPYGELDGIPQNTAHPGCTFQIEWYGFDEGDDVVSEVSFTLKAPTTDGSLTVQGPTSVPVGGDPATGAGTDDGLDGVETYTLSSTATPHPKQGWHVKLVVETPRSQGADRKSKVFWVEPCRDVAGAAGAAGAAGSPAGAAAGGTGTSVLGALQRAQVPVSAGAVTSGEVAGSDLAAATPSSVEAGLTPTEERALVGLLLALAGVAAFAMAVIRRRPA